MLLITLCGYQHHDRVAVHAHIVSLPENPKIANMGSACPAGVCLKRLRRCRRRPFKCEERPGIRVATFPGGDETAPRNAYDSESRRLRQFPQWADWSDEAASVP